jgi:hypothetical protein
MGKASAGPKTSMAKKTPKKTPTKKEPEETSEPPASEPAVTQSEGKPDHATSVECVKCDDITYVIPCESCNAFLSLTMSTDLDQICQACRTPVTALMKLVRAGKIDELPVSDQPPRTPLPWHINCSPHSGRANGVPRRSCPWRLKKRW